MGQVSSGYTVGNSKMTTIELLKKLEWCGIADYQLFSVPKCPICGGLKSDTEINDYQTVEGGHKTGCELEIAIQSA